jgi:hypothetical protein
METFKYTVISIMCGIVANAITLYIQGTRYMDWDLFILIVYVFIMLVVGWSAYRHSKRMAAELDRRERATASNTLLATLHKYAAHPDILKIIDANGKLFIDGHADNFYWKEIAGAICKGMGLTNLRYSNLGTQYHLQDIANGRTIEIPTDNRLEEKMAKAGVKNGQILLIVENT